MSTIERIWKCYLAYYGNSLFGVFFLLIAAAVCISRKEKGAIRTMAGVSVLLTALIAFPLTAKVMMTFMGPRVYWRVFWMLPAATMLSWGLVRLTGLLRGRWKKTLLVVLCLAAVSFHGNLILTGKGFSPAANPYKISPNVIDAVEAIHAHASEHRVKKIKIVGTLGMATLVRQYDASILQRYGRNVSQFSYYGSELYYQINTEDPDLTVIADGAIKSHCRYIVMSNVWDDPQILDEKGFDLVHENEQYAIYFNREYDRAKKKK